MRLLSVIAGSEDQRIKSRDRRRIFFQINRNERLSNGSLVISMFSLFECKEEKIGHGEERDENRDR